MATAPPALIHNWRLKTSALGLAVFLWALVQTEPRSEEVFPSVPVRVEVVDTVWTASGAPSPADVELRLDGPAREIIRLYREGPTVRIPISSVGSQDTLVTLRRDWVELGGRVGVVVASISPPAVSISFERATTRMIPVAKRLQGRLRDDLAQVADVVVNPQAVRIRGPQSRVAGLDSIPLEPFDLDRVSASGAYTVEVDTSGLAGASVVPPTATLDVQVENKLQRVLQGLVVQAEVSPGEAAVVADPPTVRVTLTGAHSVVSSLDPSTLLIRIPVEFLEGMTPGEERPVRFVVEGVPKYVVAVPGREFVTVRRATDVAGGGEGDGSGP